MSVIPEDQPGGRDNKQHFCFPVEGVQLIKNLSKSGSKISRGIAVRGASGLNVGE